MIFKRFLRELQLTPANLHFIAGKNLLSINSFQLIMKLQNLLGQINLVERSIGHKLLQAHRCMDTNQRLPLTDEAHDGLRLRKARHNQLFIVKLQNYFLPFFILVKQIMKVSFLRPVHIVDLIDELGMPVQLDVIFYSDLHLHLVSVFLSLFYQKKDKIALLSVAALIFFLL